MPGSTQQPFGIDVSAIEPAETRRALRTALQQMEARFQAQQDEIEALLELLTDRHTISVGEFLVHLRRVQQRDDRTARLHALVTQTVQQAPSPASAAARPAAAAPARPAPAAITAPSDMEEDDSGQHPNVYRL